MEDKNEEKYLNSYIEKEYNKIIQINEEKEIKKFCESNNLHKKHSIFKFFYGLSLYYLEKEKQNSLNIFCEIINKDNRKDVFDLISISGALSYLSKFKESLELLKKINYQSSFVYFLYGRNYDLLKDFVEAEKYYLIAINYNDVKAMNNLGKLLLNKK
jgi:tetratricopeptide (TPR) repeat protein